MCKEARDFQKNLRVAVRGVGIRHERNLFNCGVKEQLSHVINYLETGRMPRWMIDNHEELLDKDLTKAQKIVVPRLES
jgi:hypothetical protein